MSDKLRAVLQQMRNLSYDELINLIVMMEFNDKDLRPPGAGERRKGKPGGLYATQQRERRIAVEALALKKDDRRSIYEMALILAQALAPRTRVKRDPDTGQPLARGTVQTKIIWRWRWNFETQERERRPFGPYLYIRLWATGGDDSRRARRYTNVYVRGSKSLAAAYQAGKVTADEILNAFHAGTIQSLVDHYNDVLKEDDAPGAE